MTGPGGQSYHLAARPQKIVMSQAAAHCIVHEAGGKMTDMLGNDISYNNKDVYHHNGILVTNGLLHDKIVKEFKKL